MARILAATTKSYRIIKWTFGFIGLLLAFFTVLAAITFSIYYQSEIHPYKNVVKNIIANAKTENHHLSAQMQTMIDANFYCIENPQSQRMVDVNPNCDISKEYQVAKLIQDHHLTTYKPRTKVVRGIDEALLIYFIVRPLSRKEQNTLISELTFFTPKANDFTQFSKLYFHKPLSQLTLDETATLVAFTKAPSHYLQDNERLKQRQQILLNRYDLIKAKHQ